MWAPLRDPSEEDYRRFSLFAHGDQSPEISISRNDNTPFLPGTLEDRLVVGGLETVVTYVTCIVPGLPQPVRY